MQPAAAATTLAGDSCPSLLLWFHAVQVKQGRGILQEQRTGLRAGLQRAERTGGSPITPKARFEAAAALRLGSLDGNPLRLDFPGIGR